MKYGRVVHVGFARSGESRENRLISVGDIFECLALQKVYEKMGVDKENIVDCYQHDMENYVGEYIVLPINVYSLNVHYSPRILPVFLGLTLGGEHEISEQELNILRRFSPVGCRDERTMRRLLDKGIDAYFAGCIVATFPEREQNLPTQDTVFFVDPQRGIKDYVPERLLKKYKFFSHDYYMTPEEMTDGATIYEYGEKVLDMYRREAKLIVTSKFHAAVMALALGIPVILIMENCYYKYTWIQKFIPVYEPKDFDKIDWDPRPVVINDSEKQLMLDIACQRIRSTYDKYISICTLSEIRENPEIREFEDIFYGAYALEFIKKTWWQDIEIEYAFWGCTQTAVKLYEFIQTNYPKAKLCRIYDTLVENEFLGLTPVKPSEIERDKDYFIFVTGNSASGAAKELFRELGKTQDRYFCCEREVLREEDLVGENERG